MNTTDPKPPQNDAETRNERDLFWIMTFSTSLGFGVLTAFLCSLKDIKNDVSFEFSIGTVVGFVAGASAGWFFWRILRRMMERAREREE